MPYLFFASLAVNVIGQLLGSNAKQAALNRQARYEEAQAAIAMQDAQYEAWRAEQSRHAQVGHAKVALSASGVDTSQGTGADTLAQVSTAGEMDAQLALIKGNRVAWTHQEQARLLRAGVDDVQAALPFDIAAMGLNTYAQYSAIGKKPDGSGIWSS